jgi:hypothetical protein
MLSVLNLVLCLPTPDDTLHCGLAILVFRLICVYSLMERKDICRLLLLRHYTVKRSRIYGGGYQDF